MSKKIFTIAIILLFSLVSFADNRSESDSVAVATASEGKMNIPEFILEHIGDSYYWHIATYKGHEISIPLPVIVRSADGEWHLFSSSRFEHGHTSYKGFKISHSEKYRGKIVETSAQGEEVRPLDFSITKNVFALMINSSILVIILLLCARWYRNKGTTEANPKGFVAGIEMFIMSIVDGIIKPCVGKNYKRYTPYLLTAFFFIFINSLMGLVPIFPGGANITGNIAITFTLAMFTFVIVNIFGTREYWKEIFWPNVPWWLKVPIPLIPVIEVIGMFTKPFALMIRLFANILAGHSVIIGLVCIVFVTVELGTAMNAGMTVLSVIMTTFVNLLEVLVAYIQAYVFTILSAVFIGLSQAEPHHQKSH